MDAWSRGPHLEQFWPVHVWQTCSFVLISHTRWKLRWCVQSAARRNIDASNGLIPNGRRTRQSSWVIREATSTGVKHATTILASMLPSGQCGAEMMRQRSFSRRNSRGSGDRLPRARQRGRGVPCLLDEPSNIGQNMSWGRCRGDDLPHGPKSDIHSGRALDP